MTERSGRKLALVIFAAVLLVCVSVLAWRAGHRRSSDAAQLRAGWRQRNAASLLALSAVTGFSAEEQGRVNRAGDDVEQLRRALIEIHELRLAYAGRDLEDAQKRKADLGGPEGYKVYADRPSQTDLVELINQDEFAATAKIASYAQALNRIRAWQPVSYDRYLAERTAPVGVPPLAPQIQAAASQQKPDPRVPLGTRRASQRAASPAAETAIPLPSGQEMAESAMHPAMTVYAEPGTRARASAAEGMELASREQEEQQMRETLGQWSHAMVLNDPHAEVTAYAPHMDRYFLRRNVDKRFVEADKAAYLRRGNLTASFSVEDVRFENETADAADVRLVKDVAWQRSSDGVTHKQIRSLLHLVRTSTGWKIAGEQDFR